MCFRELGDILGIPLDGSFNPGLVPPESTLSCLSTESAASHQGHPGNSKLLDHLAFPSSFQSLHQQFLNVTVVSINNAQIKCLPVVLHWILTVFLRSTHSNWAVKSSPKCADVSWLYIHSTQMTHHSKSGSVLKQTLKIQENSKDQNLSLPGFVLLTESWRDSMINLGHHWNANESRNLKILRWAFLKNSQMEILGWTMNMNQIHLGNLLLCTRRCAGHLENCPGNFIQSNLPTCETSFFCFLSGLYPFPMW